MTFLTVAPLLSSMPSDTLSLILIYHGGGHGGTLKPAIRVRENNEGSTTGSHVLHHSDK